MTTTDTPRGLRYYDASHRYKLDGQWVPGVTTILGVLDKPALVKASANEVARFVTEEPNTVDLIRDKGGPGAAYEFLRNFPQWKWRQAGKRGNVLHDYAEAILNGDDIEVAGEHIAVMESAIAFMEDWHIEPLLIEAPVASREHKWAGTLDLIAKYTRPDTGVSGVCIADWKSGKALYPEYVWQLNAYAHAEFTGLKGDESPLPACDAAFGVQIRDDGYTVAPFEFGPHIYDEFLTIRRTHDIAKRGRGDWKVPGSGYVGLPITAEVA